MTLNLRSIALNFVFPPFITGEEGANSSSGCFLYFTVGNRLMFAMSEEGENNEPIIAWLRACVLVCVRACVRASAGHSLCTSGIRP